MDALALQILQEKSVTDSAGARLPLHSHTQQKQCELLEKLVHEARPTVSLEIGFAYGISTLAICHALKDVGAKRHIVMDPMQSQVWKGIGLLNVRRAGYAELVDFREQYAHEVLPELLKDGTRVDFAYIDGAKMFDSMIVSFFYLTRLMNNGALMVLDDCDFPSVRRAVQFLTTHPSFALYGAWGSGKSKQKHRLLRRIANHLPGHKDWLAGEQIDPDPRLRDNPHCVAFKKIKDDDRPWDWHERF